MGKETIAAITFIANSVHREIIGEEPETSIEAEARAFIHKIIENEETKQKIQGVAKAVDYILSSEEISPEAMHNEWVDCKRRSGWTYGEKQSIENKTHPCLVPFDELSKEQREKDNLFISLSKALLNYKEK